MDMGAEFSAVAELVASLEAATLLSKQLPNTTEHSKITQIYATLHSAHFHLSSFLHQSSQPQPSLQPPPPPAAAGENSLSSAAGNNDDDDEPMQLADNEDDAEQEESNSKAITIDGVEERMRDFSFIQNKRLKKRPLSPASAAAAEDRRRRWSEDERDLVRGSAVGFDPLGTRLRALDLIYQFHG